MAWRYNRQPSLEAVRRWVAYHRAGTLALTAMESEAKAVSPR
ncbi:MAG: hypothetical protein AB2814_08790 [Candidatus Sedimenticola endophacoides]